MEVDIEIHSVDDWEVIYVNGTAFYQNHSNALESWMDRMESEGNFPLTIRSMKSEYHEGDVMDYHVRLRGRFPADRDGFNEAVAAVTTELPQELCELADVLDNRSDQLRADLDDTWVEAAQLALNLRKIAISLEAGNMMDAEQTFRAVADTDGLPELLCDIFYES